MSINEFVLDSVNVPTEIRDVASDVVKQAFKKAGFKKKHLNDPKLKEMAKELIMEDMKKYTMSEEETKEETKSTVPSPPSPPSPSPPPSSDTKVAPPQPPPSSSDTKVLLPPPPPPAKLNQTEKAYVTKIEPVIPTAPKTDLSKTSVPPPPMIKGKAPPPPPPPPKQQNNTFKLVDSKTGKLTESKPKEKTMLELIREQNANLKPVTHKKEQKPLVDKDSLESKLQALLQSRKEELQKDDSSDDSDVSDDDSDEFD